MKTLHTSKNIIMANAHHVATEQTQRIADEMIQHVLTSTAMHEHSHFIDDDTKRIGRATHTHPAINGPGYHSASEPAGTYMHI
jgi:hypothetical protein